MPSNSQRDMLEWQILKAISQLLESADIESLIISGPPLINNWKWGLFIQHKQDKSTPFIMQMDDAMTIKISTLEEMGSVVQPKTDEVAGFGIDDPNLTRNIIKYIDDLKQSRVLK